MQHYIEKYVALHVLNKKHILFITDSKHKREKWYLFVGNYISGSAIDNSINEDI